MLTFLLAQALANAPVVTVGTDVVAGSPASKVHQAAWVPVLADCLEEGLPGALPVVDRTVAGEALLGDVEALRSLDPAAVVISVGARESIGAEAGPFRDQLQDVVQLLRGDGGPAVYLVGLVPPDLVSSPEALPGREGAAVEAGVRSWNEGLARLAGADDGVWFVDLWAGWPEDPEQRARLLEGGLRLTDPAHARIGAVICEQILTNLRKTAK